MAQIYNTELTKELIAGGGIQTSRDNVPNQLADKVVPVMEVNPRMLRTCNIVTSNITATTGNVTIFTAPTDRDSYINSAYLSMAKDVTCDGTSISLTAIIQGITVNLLSIRGITLTALNQTLSISYPAPIKIDKGSLVLMTFTFSVGVVVKGSGITGFSENMI
jgi:hypothetical protein